MTYHPRKFTAQITPDELERLIYHMETVASLIGDEWAKGFARSVIKQSRRKSWKPTPKQLSFMRKLVADLFADDLNQGADIQLIE